MKIARLFGISLCLVLAASWSPAASKKKKDEPDPDLMKATWQLRDRYTFDAAQASLVYFNDNGEWRIMGKDSAWLIQGVNFEIVLGDGKVIRSTELGTARMEREPVEGPFGKGINYCTHFKTPEGLSISHRMCSYLNYPFNLAEIRLKNDGAAPITVAAVKPVVIGPGGIANPDGKTLLKSRALNTRGGVPVYAPDKAPLGVAIQFPEKRVNVIVAAVPMSEADSGANFSQTNGVWQGDITCAYAPAIRLAPGQAVTVPPVFISFGHPNMGRADNYYSWVFSNAPRAKWTTKTPAVWASIEEGQSLDGLIAAANELKSCGVTHALIPAGWEKKTGALEGDSPRFPKKIASAAATLRGAGFTPGLTVDPLAVQDLKQGWFVDSQDGLSWLNPKIAEARAAAVKRLGSVLRDGFGFVVVQLSAIPDAVLTQLELTRAEADRIAFNIAAEAAGDMPVFPSAAGTLDRDLDAWLEAAAASSRMAEYAVASAPVRFLASGDALGEPLLAAMRFWGGPIEVAGRPSAALRADLARLIARGRISARPVDGASRGPKLWQIHSVSEKAGYLGEVIVAFPGAPAWTLADLDLTEDTPLAIWRAADGAFVPKEQGAIGAAQQLTIYGATPLSDRPSFMGANGDVALFLRNIGNLNWDAQKMTLSGRLDGAFGGTATAYVHVPAGWALRSGKAGGQTVKKKVEGERIAFDLESGRADFQLEFSRN